MPMFSHEARTTYRKNQLGEVICQLRFPEILSIEANLPVDFQEAIRDTFPVYSSRKEAQPPKLSGLPGQLTLEKQPQITNHQFASSDNQWRVNLTSGFLSLACSRYHSWEEFAKKLDKPLAAFIQIYKPAFYERVGLRYLNFISRKDLSLEDVPFRELLQPCYLGLLAEEDVLEASSTRSSLDTELGIRGGCRAKIHAGPGMLKIAGQQQQEVRFILDLDVFMPGQIPVNHSAGALQTLHSQAWSIFRGAITDTLHDAMEPEEI